MINMQMSAEEAKEYASCEPTPDNMPRYPYGLRLCLDDDALAKLNMTMPPAVGTTMTISAQVTVVAASSSQRQGGDAESSSEWQITDMEVSTASKSGNHATALYGS